MRNQLTHRSAPRFVARWLLGCALLTLLGACAGLPPREASPVSVAPVDVASTRLARIAESALATQAQRVPGLSGFRPLPEGEFAFDARTALARHAERSLDVQYYLIQDDELGRQLLRELRDAARRGVRVRLLVDDLYAAGMDELYAGLAAHPNVEVRIFNPLPVRSGAFMTRLLFSMHQFGRINHRMHNKLFLADNSVAISGGRNIAAEYFMRSVNANFVDLDLLSSGPIVRDFSATFDAFWNSEHVYPIAQLVNPNTALDRAAAQRRFDELVRDAAPPIPLRERDVLRRTPVSRQLERGELEQMYATARVVFDRPDKLARPVTEREADSVLENVVNLFGSGRQEVLIVSPYFIPDPRGLAMMERAGARNGRVVLMTNSLGATDEPLVYWSYARRREAMLKAGVTIYELSPSLVRKTGEFGNFGASMGRLHAKLATIDRRWLYVGSMNLDGRSARYNTEVGLIIDSEEIVADIRKLRVHEDVKSAYRLRLKAKGEGVEWVEHDAEGREIVHTDEPDGSWILRLKYWLFSPFVMEEFL